MTMSNATRKHSRKIWRNLSKWMGSLITYSIHREELWINKSL